MFVCIKDAFLREILKDSMGGCKGEFGVFNDLGKGVFCRWMLGKMLDYEDFLLIEELLEGVCSNHVLY